MSLRKMGSNKSHGKKSDKETQSPMLKIFRDIMQREKVDPEKTNLLKGKYEDRKRKHYSESRTKLDRKCDSSSSDRLKNTVRDSQYNKAQEVRNTEYECRTQSFGDKKDSWWFWAAQTEGKNRDDDETCSCVSCALKKLISTEYTCIGCLVLIFIITVLIAFLIVFKNVPPLTCGVKDKPHTSKAGLDSERLKRKIDLLNGKGWDSNYVGGKENIDDGNDWGDLIPRYSSDPVSTRFHDLNKIEDYEARPSELSSLFDTEKINAIQSNDHLREFYKKLLQADAQIRKLKSGFTDYTLLNTFEDSLKTSDRLKRSLEFRSKKFQHFKKKMDNNTKAVKPKKPFHVFHSPIKILKHTNNKNTNDTMRPKRNDNKTEPLGFVIEKKKVIVQYKPNAANRKVPKCSHVPKESKSHEKQLKHPFYKNTQRLDELLDQFLDKNLHEIMSDPFGIEAVLEKETNKCKHPNPYKNDDVLVKEDHYKQMPNIIYDKDRPEEIKLIQDTKRVMKPETTTFEKDLFSRDFNVDIGRDFDETTTTYAYDILMSVSTVINSDIKTSSSSADLIARVPNLRKLMQIEEDDEYHGYQDLKVLADAHKENDRKLNRNKRFGDTETFNQQHAIKYNPPGVQNPNWKGPMPLYPDEINSMIKQAAMNINKDNYPVNTKDISPETDNLEGDISDVEYLEDYLNNKYDKLAKMAQAYSDYGVLDGKKETANEKKVSNDLSDPRVKMSVGKRGFFHQMFRRPKKGSQSAEGFKFEMKPTTLSRDDSPLEIYKALHKHIKITNPNGRKLAGVGPTTSTPTFSNFDLVLPPEHGGHSSDTDDDKKKKHIENDDSLIFSLGRRTLKAIEVDDDNNSEEDRNSNILKETEITINTKCDTINKTSQDKDTDVEENKGFDTKINGTKADMDLSQFFKILSNFFSFLDGFDISDKTQNTSEIATDPKSQMANNNNYSKENRSVDVIYPIYDSEIIDNIGHRSRVLLSIYDNNEAVSNYSKNEDKVEDIKSIGAKSTDAYTEKTESVKANQSTTLTIPKIKSEKTITNEQSIKIINKSDGEIINRNKTIVKRNVEDSNLIFWNDMYDDEYGIKIDPLENTIRDKHSIKKNDFIKESGKWFQDKFRKIAKIIDNGQPRNNEVKKRGSRETKSIGVETNPDGRFIDKFVNKFHKKKKVRRINEEDESIDKKQSFEVLTANMKEVCHKAAEAVRQTKNIEVREDNKDSQVATTLMQQLVRLMSDLVDYQVQQKTCSKLPRDLQNFLEWLTDPTSERLGDTESYSPGLKNEDILTDFDVERYKEKWSEQDQKPVSLPFIENNLDTEVHPSRQTCLASLQAFQELMHQYEELSEEDKSKMSGIKQYLDDQLDYLQKQLSTVDEYNIYDSKNLLRFKRDLSKRRNKEFRCKGRKKTKLRRKQTRNKYIKNYGKKHTHTTARYIRDMTFKNRPLSVPETEVMSKNIKRNLKDIYYKAIEDAKKFTTIKKFHKKMAGNAFEKTSTVRNIR